MKYKIDIETAERDFEEFCENWSIDDDIQSMKDEDRESFESQKAPILKAIRMGRLLINENKTLTYTVSDFSEKSGEEITIRRPKGSDFMNMDEYADKQSIRKVYGLISGMISHDVKYLSNLDGEDLKVLQSIATLFFQG